MKIIFLICSFIVAIVGIIFVLRFGGGNEDTWICVNNEWVKHGEPNTPKPQDGCVSF